VIATTGNAALPLARWQMGQARCVEHARALVNRAYRRHVMQPRGALALRVNRAPFGASFLIANRFDGDPVEIDTHGENGFFVEHLAWRGGCQIELDGVSQECTPERGFVISPTHRVRLRFGPDCSLVGARIEPGRIQRQLELLTGRAPRGPLAFSSVARHDRGPGLRRRRLLHWAVEELEHAAPPGGVSLLPSLEEAYLDALLTGQPHSHMQLVEARRPDAGVAAVRRVEDYIRAHPERAVSSERLVSLSGVSTSALYEAFQRQRGTSPMRLLRDVRLLRAREELSDAEREVSVTHVALRWGFTHLARFSGQYRSRFGELPSQTLRRARRAS
jgi:AraC-like DNA-binding protein